MNYRLYYDTPQALADAASSTPIDQAQSLRMTYAERESAAKIILVARESELATIQTGQQRLTHLRDSNDAEISREFRKLHMDMVLECKSIGDAGRYAEKSARQIGVRKCLNYALISTVNEFLPRAVFNAQVARANWFRETASRLMAEALIAAIERYEAAKPLIAVDQAPVVLETRTGRAHSIWQAAIQAARHGAEAEQGADVERKRLQTIAESNK